MIKKYYVRGIKTGMYVRKNANGTYGLEQDYNFAKSFDDKEKAQKLCNNMNKTFDSDKTQKFEVVKEIRENRTEEE